MSSGQSSFVYVTYIRATAEKVWQALFDPAFTRQFWACLLYTSPSPRDS